jgi:hypothetical protein
MKLKLSAPVIEELKKKEFRSVIIFGASNPAELKDTDKTSLLASKELILEERITQNSFHVSIDDPVLIEICNRMEVFIEVPQ